MKISKDIEGKVLIQFCRTSVMKGTWSMKMFASYFKMSMFPLMMQR